MPLIQIKNCFTGSVLFEKDCDSLKFCLEAAVEGGANLRDANLHGANLRDANLHGANLGDANLHGAYLGGANLGGANLHDANLHGANLGGAYLGGANLHDANLHGANLGGAYLGGAYLGGANLRDANLHGAYLGGANLRGATLHGAYLGGANLGGATYGENILMTKPPIQVSGLTWSVLILDAHMQIGCELHSLGDWAAFDNERIARMDGASARRFWGVNKESLLALARANGRSFEAVEEQAA